MKHLQLKHWQDPVTALLGAWFAVSPWVLGQPTGASVYAFVAIGLALLAFGAAAAYKPHAWLEWVSVALGVLAIALPWLLGVAGESRVTENSVIVGVLAVILSLWALAEDGHLGGWRHDRMAH